MAIHGNHTEHYWQWVLLGLYHHTLAKAEPVNIPPVDTTDGSSSRSSSLTTDSRFDY